MPPILEEEAQEMEALRKEAPEKARNLSKNNNAEVGAWLVWYLPRVRRADAEEYHGHLINGGFDSNEALEFVTGNDLAFMKIGHTQALVRKRGGAWCGNNSRSVVYQRTCDEKQSIVAQHFPFGSRKLMPQVQRVNNRYCVYA